MDNVKVGFLFCSLDSHQCASFQHNGIRPRNGIPIDLCEPTFVPTPRVLAAGTLLPTASAQRSALRIRQILCRVETQPGALLRFSVGK